MTTLAPMMACGPSFGPEILIIPAIWLGAIVAAIANLALLCPPQLDARLRIMNLGVLAGYALTGVGLVEGAFSKLTGDFVMALVLGIPALALAHFIFLFFMWRVERKA